MQRKESVGSSSSQNAKFCTQSSKQEVEVEVEVVVKATVEETSRYTHKIQQCVVVAVFVDKKMMCS